jgi:hypothetical protein
LVEIRELGIGGFDFSALPSGRIKSLARIAGASKTNDIERMPDQQKAAMLVAFAYVFEEVAQDDALDVFDCLVTDILRRSKNEGKSERLKSLKQLDAAALRLCGACEIVLDPELTDAEVRSEIFSVLPAEQLKAALATVWSIARPRDHDYFDELMGKWNVVRSFLPGLLNAIQFQATPGGMPVLKAVEFLRGIESSRKPSMDDAPKEVLTKWWLQRAFNYDGTIDRRAYTFCVLKRLHECLKTWDFRQPQQQVV